MTTKRLLAFCATVLTATSLLHGDTVMLQPIADSSLLEIAPNNNLGGGTFFNAGTAGNGNRNRGLLRYDIAGSIPAQSVITSVSLSMDVVREPISGMEFSLFELRRVFQAWGEGTQVPSSEFSPGFGGPARPGEVTWNERFFGAATWSTPGGAVGTDFSDTISASAPSAGMGSSVDFGSTPELVSDVTFWLTQPNDNFGWVVMTDSEGLGKTARSFASRESGFGPTLIIEFTPIPEPSTMALFVMMGVIASSLAGKALARRRVLCKTV